MRVIKSFLLSFLLAVSVSTAFGQSNVVAPAIEKPAADVPKTCAAFAGGWNGFWPTVGWTWLWVVEVDANCIAKYYYGKSTKTPKSFKTAEIKNGVLKLERPGGATTFTLRGDELAGEYNGDAGNNEAVMKRIKTE